MTDAELRRAVDDAQAAFDDVLPRPESLQPHWWLAVVGLETALAAALAGRAPWWTPILALLAFWFAMRPEIRRDRQIARETGIKADDVRRRPTGDGRVGCAWGLLLLGPVIGFGIWGGDRWYVGVAVSAALSLAARFARRRRTPWIPRWPERDGFAKRHDAFASLDTLRVFAVLAMVESVSGSQLAERLGLDTAEVDAVVADLTAAGYVSQTEDEDAEPRYKANWASRRAFRDHLKAIAPRASTAAPH